MSISFAATPQSKEAQQARTYTDPSAGAPPSRRSGYNAPYVDLGHWNKVFTDQNYFDSIAKQKGMTEGAKVSLHGDDYVYRQAMIGYLADTRKVPLDDMRSIFDAEKDGFAKKVLGKQTASAREMFDWQKGQFERSNEKKAAADQILQGVIRRSLEDALSGGDTPFVESVGKDINAASEMFDDEEKSRLWEKAEELDIKIRASQDRFAPEARFIFDALQQSTGQKTGFGAPDMRDMASRFAQLPDNQRQAIYELAGGFAQITQTDKGFWYQMAESLGRGASDIVERVPRNFREQTLRGQLRLLNGQQPLFRAAGVAGAQFSQAGPQGATPITPEEREEAKAKIQSDLGVLKVERELRDLAERVVDPIKTIGVLPEIIEEGLYGAARSIPYTAAAAVPIAGVPAVASALFSSNYDRIMLEYPDLDPDKAALIAAISAPIEAGLERMKVNTITGRLPVFGGLVKRLQHPNQRNITRIAIGGAGIVAEQNVQEIMQNATFPFVQTIAAALDADMPDYDWEERLAGMPRELAVQFVALLPLSLMGVGALSYREISRGENYLKSKADLEKAGYNEEQIDRITGAESAEAAQAALVEEHAKRDPKLVKAAAQRIVDESIALREKANPAALPRLEKQGADYVVLSPEGKELARSTDQTAAEQALVSARRKTVQREMRDVHTGINEAVAFIQKVNEARQRGEDVAEVIRESAPRTLLSDYEANPTQENLDRLFETVRAFGQEINEPAELANFPVTGSNQGALREGIWRSIIRINEGADGTIVMREFAQDNLKRAMAEGRVTIDFVRQQLNDILPQIDSDRMERRLRTETDTDVIEAFSDIAVAYFRGSIREEQIPAGLRGIMRRLAIFTRDIFRRAYNLSRLRAEGKLDRDFEALLAETVGVDQQALVDRSREKTAQEMEGNDLEQRLRALWPSLTEEQRLAIKQALQNKLNEATGSTTDQTSQPATQSDLEQKLRAAWPNLTSEQKEAILQALRDKLREIKGEKTAQEVAPDGRGVDGLTDDERFALEQELQAEMERDAAEAAGEGGIDILDAVREAGGLPAKTSSKVYQYSGELQRIREASKGGNAIGVKGVFNLFRKNAPDLDALIKDLQTMGFNQITTPSDLFDMVERRIMTGRPIYGYEAAATAQTVGNYSIAITHQQDAAYLAAVERGDMETAQRMVDEAAKAAGYTIKGFHGTDSPVFTTFEAGEEGGIFFADKKFDAKIYGRRTIAAYLSINNPYKVTWSEISEELGGDNSLSPWSFGFDELKKQGYDGIIVTPDDVSINYDKEVGEPEFSYPQFIALSPEQIKSADPVTRDDNGNVIPLSQRFDATTADINYSIGLQSFKDWFGDWENDPANASKVVGPDGKPLVVYHGTQRPDRIGSRFRKSRATSGPMAFFTAVADIASSYAKGKSDTSLELPNDYAGWFKYKGKGMRSAVDIDRAWWSLSEAERETIRQRIYTVGYENADEATGPIVSNSSSIMGRDSIDYELRQARGNALRALVETWLTSGSLFNREEEFMQVLEAAGMDMGRVTYDSPFAVRSAVYPVYLSIKNPLNTSNIPADVFAALEQAGKRKRAKRSAGGNADAWDKNTISGKDWLEALRYDMETGSTMAWTRIPDWATEALAMLGYDGIHDLGGKYGGEKHDVWIPFVETQVKSATGNRGTFDPTNPDINYSIGTPDKDGVVRESDDTTEAGTLAPDTDLTTLNPDQQQGEDWQDIPWEQTEKNYSIAPAVLPEAFPVLDKALYDQILAETDTTAAIHIDRLRVGEYEGVMLQGGMYFPAIVENLKNGVVWAFNSKGVASAVAERARANGGYVKLVLMLEGNVIGNKTFATIWFKQLRKNIKAGKITTEQALAEINAIRERYVTRPVKGVTTKFTGHDKVFTTLKQAEKSLMEMPQIKRGNSYFQKTSTVTKRDGEKIAYQSLLSQAMTSKGFPDAAKIVESIEEPAFKGLPKGTIVGLIKIDPDAVPMSAAEAGVTEHISYGYVLKGKPVARMAKHQSIDALYPQISGKLMSQQAMDFPASQVLNYSISTQREIDRVQAAMDRLARTPSERISQYAALKERLAVALERNKPIMQSMRGDTLPQDFDRTRILNDLGFLDYILKVLPPEVRGRVGGYTNLASIAPVDVYKGDQKVSEAKNPAGAIISAWMREGQNIGQAQKNTALPEGYSTVPNTTDERRDKTIANFLIDRLKKIDRELERYYKRDLMERIFDVLDKSRPKAGQSGVKRSTLGAETQKFADTVYRSSLLDDEKTAERLAAIEAQITSTEATADSQKRISELSEEWTIVNTFGDLKSRPSETLAYGLEWLQTQLKAGREAWQIKEAARIQENRERAAKVIAFLGKPTDFGRFENKSALQRFLQAVNAFDLDHKSFDQFAPYLFGDEVAAELSKKMQRAQIDEAKLELENTRSILAALRQGAKAAGMSTSKALVAFKENQPYAVRKMEGRKVKDTKISIELAKKIVRGLADRGSLSNQDVQTLSDELAALPRDTKKEFVTIKQVIFRGEEVRLTMSRAQAMQLWLTWQQSDAQEKMRADGFTDDSFDDLDNLISGPFAQAILRVTSRIYGSGYALTNPIYARMFGMNMPMVRNYAPARYLSSKEVKDVGLDGSPLTAGGQPSFAKSRVNHTAKLAPEDALTVLQSHIAMQSHWVAFAEVTREYRSLLSNPDVRESIRQRLGADVLRTAEMWGDQMEQRGGNKGREIAWINNMLGAVIGGQSVSLLGYNLKSLMMQTDNLMRFTLALDSRQIGSALSDPVALMQNVRKVWKTDIIQTRLEGGATAETRFFFERFVSMFRRGAKVAEMSMMPMNYLDSAGLSISGAIVYQAAYKDALDSGVDPTSAERAAKDAVEAMVYRYGQPVLMGQKSNIENSGNAFTKAFFLFMSDPRLKMAIISDSVRGLATGRGDWKTHVRRIVAIEMMAVVSHVLATAFRDATSDDDDEDLWSMGGFARALLLAPFQGYFLLGSVSDLVLSRLTEAQWFTPTQNPLIRTADTAFRAFNNLDDAFNFDDPDALVKEWTNITRSIAVTPPLAAPAVIMNIVRPLVQGWERMDDDE